MKVICIDNTAKCDLHCVGSFMPIEGNSYEVVNTFMRYNYEWYQLKEDIAGNGWNPKYFIPIDENKFDTVLKKVLSVPKMSGKNYNAPEKK